MWVLKLGSGTEFLIPSVQGSGQRPQLADPIDLMDPIWKEPRSDGLDTFSGKLTGFGSNWLCPSSFQQAAPDVVAPFPYVRRCLTGTELVHTSKYWGSLHV